MYTQIASTLDSMGLSVVLEHPIEDDLIHIHVALLNSRTALQLEGTADHCTNDQKQLLGSTLLRRCTLEKHGWKVCCDPCFYAHGVMAWKEVGFTDREQGILQQLVLGHSRLDRFN